MLDTVKINHVQHISFTQSRLTDAVSVILSELLSYEHPSNCPGGNSFQYQALRNRARKSFVSCFCGFPNTSEGTPSSQMTP